MKITKEQLKSWGACVNGYRWFLNKFPDGGEYAEVHQKLLHDGRIEDLEWLTENMYRSFFDNSELPLAEVSAGNKMIETMNNMYTPAVEQGGSLASSGDQAKQASIGDRARQASSGRHTQQASNGDWTRQASSGDLTKQTSSGEAACQASSGHLSWQASSGRGTKQASSGRETCHASSGAWTRQASSGLGTKHLSTGALSKVATSGAAVEIIATGDDSVVAAADVVCKIVLGEGGCAAIAYQDGDRTRFAVAYVGENGIEAGIAYTVNEKGEFVKLEQE